MDIINKLTLENIKRNRKRSAVTVIGIALSCALICAVAGIAMSAQKTLVEYARTSYGDFHITYYDVPEEQLSYIQNNVNVERYFLSRSIGWGQLYAQGSPYTDRGKEGVTEATSAAGTLAGVYYYLTAMSDEALAGMNLYLLEGRLPEQENEIAVMKSLLTEAEGENKIGDILTLEYGMPAQTGDSITQTTYREYTIVGVFENSYMIGDDQYPGYPVVTYLPPVSASASGGDWNIAVTFRDPKAAERTHAQILEQAEPRGGVVRNRELLRYEGSVSENELDMLYKLGGIVILIIALTSIFVIRNSFSISVSEKSRQYGILASVGATSRQVRSSVLFEGFVLGALGIPSGVFLGIAVVRILIRLLNFLLGDLVVHRMVFLYSIPPVVIGMTVLLGIVTIYFSALLPAVRAGRISPMEAIRQNREILSGKRMRRASRLVKRVFGIGGVIADKNLKRSRKKYRTTVISLVVSVAVFIALYSFVDYGKRLSGMAYTDYQYDVGVYGITLDGQRELASLPEVEKYSSSAIVSATYSVSEYGTEYAARQKEEDLSRRKENGLSLPEGEKDRMGLEIIVLNKEYFEEYAKSLGLSGDVSRGGILGDYMITYQENGAKKMECYIDLEKAEEFRCHVELWEQLGEGEFTVPILKRADTKPMGYENRYVDGGSLFVSEELIGEERLQLGRADGLYIRTGDPDGLEETLSRIRDTQEEYQGLVISNLSADADAERRILLVIEIFLYGFIAVITLIGVTNIFNTVTTNMILRSKEFAMLKSIGMTTREFNRMIRLESLMYGMRSLCIGIPAGVAGSLWIYRTFAMEFDSGYLLPWQAILICVFAVFLIVGLTMRYSLSRINKQNIIETIRNENI